MKLKVFLPLLALVSGMAVVALVSARGGTPAPPASALSPVPAIDLAVQGRLPSLDGATQWINSKPVTAARLRGKVVLVNFWTYSCINSLRQIPYVRAWAEKYKQQGLVVIGVHAPEFDFEHDITNVRRAGKQWHLDYPLAIDNDHRVWDAFDNQYWPALYFVDAQGRIRHMQFGEGDYARSERVIQQLLRDAGAKGVGDALVSPRASGAEAPADWNDQGSAENYLGYARTEGFVSPAGVQADQPHDYTAPALLELNRWALAGSWTIGQQATVLRHAGGRIVYRFHARDMHLVMGPSANGSPVRFQVTIDGKPPGDAHGEDVDSHGNGVVTEARLYQLIRQPGPIADRLFEIKFFDPGVRTYAFTFG